MFDIYEETDDEAGAKCCFKCGNAFCDPVYVSFSAQPIGCTSCCKQKSVQAKVNVAVLELCLKNGWGNKNKILQNLKKEKEKSYEGL